MENIQGFIAINTYALLLMIFIMVVFFSKSRLHKTEDSTYSYLLIITTLLTFTGIILGLMVMPEFNINKFLLSFMNKIYLVFLYLWTILLTFYTYYVSRIKSGEPQKAVKLFTTASSIITFLILALPIETSINNGLASAEGASVYLTYLSIMVCYIVMFVLLILDHKNFKNKKYYPVYTLAVLGSLILVVQMLTNLNYLINPSLVLVITFMYFTIENPDVNMLNELYKNKELVEQNYEDKYNFLFEMTQEARNPIISINGICNEVRDEDSPKKIKEALVSINNLTRQLDFSINNILNISSLDVQKIKIVNSKYDLGKVCSDLVTRIKPMLKENVDFQLSLPKQVPFLYGDYMKLRQILYSILVNSANNTENGTVSLRVNLIEKYDICRLVFNISDTGRGMSIEKINEIISATGELDKKEIESLEKKEFNVKVCQKVIKIMGGNLMIKSNVGKGTDVIITLDQRVYHEKEHDMLTEYENSINSYKRVLVVCQNKPVINTIKKILSGEDMTYSILYYGMDAIDKIKSGKKYDFILIEDEMKEMSGFMTFKGMKEIKKFNIPTIVMLKEDKEKIKEHYLDDGFSDYIMLSDIENELKKIINKY